MVDCGNSRCAQDRRVLKKELLTWTKKVPILVGIEAVAEELLGKDVLHKLMEPFNNLEERGVNDWKPQSTCHFCDCGAKSKTDTAAPEVVDLETNSNDVDAAESAYMHHMLPLAYTQNILPDLNGLDEEAPLDLSAATKDCRLDDDFSKPQVELKVPQIQTKIGKKKEPGAKKNYTTEELAAAVSDIRSGKLGTRRAAALYGIPRSTLRNKIFRMESENHHEGVVPGYAADGKLSMSDLLQNMANGGEVFRESMMNGTGATGMEHVSLEDWERKLEQMRRKHDLNAGLERPFGMPPLFYNSHHMMECEKAFSLSNPYAYELKLPFLHELVRKFAEQRMEMDRHMSFVGDHMHAPKGLSHSSLENLQSQQNVELKIPSYKPMRNYANGVSPCGAGDSPAVGSASVSSSNLSRINDTLKDIIAKSIAEKMRSRAQVSNGSGFSPSPLHSPSMPYSNGTQLGERDCSSEDSQSSEPSPKKMKHGSRRDKSGENVSSSVSSDGEKRQTTADGKPLKKTRPKRGQYRKYNSQLLLEAVRAVQRGEMSVHRAGSYFGVPHSTLEYKVKERHLLRQKKAKEAAAASASASSTSTTTTSRKPASEGSEGSPSPSIKTSVSDDGSETPKPAAVREKSETKTKQSPSKENPKPSSSSGSASASLVALHEGLPPNFPVGASPLPMGFGWPPVMGAGGMPMGLPDPAMAAYFPGFCGINMSASDLLKKLQRKVQANSGYKEGSDADDDESDDRSLQGSTSSKSHVTVK